MVANRAQEHKTRLCEVLAGGTAQLAEAVLDAARRGEAAHVTEREIFVHVLDIGRQVLELFFDSQGDGDLGETVTLPDGRVVKRSEDPVERTYQSVFGDFVLSRYVYAVRAKQKTELVPLDQRLSLPESEFSYLLQEWDQLLGVEHAFGHVVETLRTVLRRKQSVDSLERMNRQMAQHVSEFREQLPPPDPQEEGALLVLSADNKGVPMRRAGDALPPGARRKKGEKANKKQHATIGCVYTVDPKPRTAEEVVAALFRERKESGEKRSPEPVAQQKRIMACLTHAKADGTEVRGQDEVFRWMAEEARCRHRPGQVAAFLTDGQRSLETDQQRFLDQLRSTRKRQRLRIVSVLDLLHVTPRLWEAAYLFHPEGSPQAAAFVRPRLQAILEGRAAGVIRGLRRMGTKRRLTGSKANTLRLICEFLKKNLHRMRYHEYLRQGLPIATGVIEGACRYVVKDRMERAGMRWSRLGAQAMLDLRSTRVNGQWIEYQEFRIQREQQRLYPHRIALTRTKWPLAA